MLIKIFNLLVGEYQEWDEDHPIHFVGHSAGAQVVRVLQQMLADKVKLPSKRQNQSMDLDFGFELVCFSDVQGL